jgi:predicted  nucleic acid-binding Zn-ribbon protein
MANVFGILTALVLALAALVAYKNKAAYELKIEDKNKQKEVSVTAEARLKAANVELQALPEQIKEIDTDVEKLTGTEGSLQKSNVTLKEATDAQEAKVAANKEKLDTVRANLDKSGDLDSLAAKLRTTASEIEDLGQSISVSEAKLANIAAQASSSDSQLVSAKTKFENFSSGQSVATLKTRIRTIYPNWGFVTLASGNNAGVVTNSTLNVVRSGSTIAKLLVTAVESSTSSASIVPDSLGSEVTLMVGDRVEAEIKAAPATPTAPVVPSTPVTPAPVPATPAPDAAPAVTPAPAAEADPFAN